MSLGDLDFDTQSITRGGVIYQAGEAAGQIFLLRSGLVSLCLRCGDKLIEINRVSPPQVFGLEALQGARIWTSSAIAANDVELIAVDVQVAKTWIEKGPPVLKVFFDSLLAKSAALAAEEFESQLRQNDPTPCPPSCVTKLFAVIYHAASHTGTVKNGSTSVVWSAFKKYCIRAFLESPMRLEQAILILAKMGIARLEMVPMEADGKKGAHRSPEPDKAPPEEIGSVHFADLGRVRSIYELNHRIASGEKPDSQNIDYTRIQEEITQWNAAGKVKAG